MTVSNWYGCPRALRILVGAPPALDPERPTGAIGVMTDETASFAVSDFTLEEGELCGKPD